MLATKSDDNVNLNKALNYCFGSGNACFYACMLHYFVRLHLSCLYLLVFIFVIIVLLQLYCNECVFMKICTVICVICFPDKHLP